MNSHLKIDKNPNENAISMESENQGFTVSREFDDEASDSKATIDSRPYLYYTAKKKLLSLHVL